MKHRPGIQFHLEFPWNGVRDYLSAEWGGANFPRIFPIQFFLLPHLRPQSWDKAALETALNCRSSRGHLEWGRKSRKNAKNQNICLIRLQKHNKQIRFEDKYDF